MKKLKNTFKSILKKDSITYKALSKTYHFLSSTKYKIVNKKRIKEEQKKYSKVVCDAIESIKKYKQQEYIVFYNPTWLGVAGSTKGLFENHIGLEHIYKKNDIKRLANEINKNNIKSVIFSQLCDGWTELIETIKKVNENIIIKVIWHGNCYEFFSDFTWGLNKKAMRLYHDKKIDAFGFVRSTMYEFYNKIGIKSYYLQNNVINKNNIKLSSNKKGKIKIGIYNADSRELKNIYTSLSAIKLVENSMADVVPINEGAKKFANVLNLQITSLDDYIPNEELLIRLGKNDINIYPTFTENAPMFPLESFEMGVPCLLGNNNDYFVDTELGKYVILEKEDDAKYIKEKIDIALKNKNKIMTLYKQWKKEYNKKCDDLVKEFIDISR